MKKIKKSIFSHLLIIASAVFLMIFSVSLMLFISFSNEGRQVNQSKITPQLKTALVVGETKVLNVSDGKVLAPNCFCSSDVSKYHLASWCEKKNGNWCRRRTPENSIRLPDGNYRIKLGLDDLTSSQKYEVIDFYLNDKMIQQVPDLGGNSSSTGKATYAIPGVHHLNGNTTIRAVHHFANEFTGRRYSDESSKVGSHNAAESIELKTVVFEKLIQDNVCGDGHLDSGEQCDDGNTTNGDGCSSVCQTEDEPTCSNETLTTSFQALEASSFSEAVANCSALVKDDVVSGRLAEATASNWSQILGTVNNGTYWLANSLTTPTQFTQDRWCPGKTIESHKGANLLKKDSGSCLEDCPKVHDPATGNDGCNLAPICEIKTCQTEAQPTCGDGHLDEGEQCDDGNTTNGDGCSSTCQTEAQANCGNGNVETGEQCDDGENNGRECTIKADEGDKFCRYCTSDCKIRDIIGLKCDITLAKTVNPQDCVNTNGEVTYSYLVTNSGNVKLYDITLEDDKLGPITCPKNELDENTTMTCTRKANITQQTSNQAEVKGRTWDNTRVNDFAEATINICDPGDCNETCTNNEDCGDKLTCSSGHCRNNSCTGETDCTCASCGDGHKDTGEECDDGNTNNGDGCDEDCKEEKEETCQASIGDLVWYDEDGDGKKDSKEDGIKGVKVCAYDKDDEKYCDTTDKDGVYQIDNLCAGEYEVKVDEDDVKGLKQICDPDDKLDNKSTTNLKDNENEEDMDFCYRGVAPKTGAGTNIAVILLISLALTALVMIGLIKMKKL